MKAYFDRTSPAFVVREGSFDAVACNVEPKVLDFMEAVGEIRTTMIELFDNQPAPEECAQASSDALSILVNQVIEGYIYGADNRTSEPEASTSSPTTDTPVREAVLSQDV